MHASADSDERRMTGLPPGGDDLVTLATWQDPPSVRWAFRHMREVIPSQLIPAGASVPLAAGHPVDLDAVSVHRLDGSTASVAQVVEDTFTDAVVVLHDGAVVAERYLADFTPQTPHLLMSVTKSVVGSIAGMLVADGLLDPDALAAAYVPELGTSGYADATVRQILDMRTGVRFRETYDLAESEVRVMERSMGWRPRLEGDPIGAYAYLTTLIKEEEHGGRFVYRSSDTDMLGWICERAAGVRMADLIAARLWQPLGAERDAEITCDAVGSAIHDGGMSCAVRDLARFGQLLLDGGRGIVPAGWLEESWHAPADVREAFAVTDNAEVLPGGWYRNQYWFVPTAHHSVALVCLGIHGQMVFVDPATRLVAAKFSSWPVPQHTGHLIDTLRAFASVGRTVSGSVKG